MPLFTICNISLRCPHNVSVTFQLKIPHRSLLYHFENAYFEWKQKHAVLVLMIMFITLKSCVLNPISLNF